VTQQQIQIDGDKPMTLKLSTNAVMFLSQMLGAQSNAIVTQAGQQSLLADITQQIGEQHGIASPGAVVPTGGAVPLPAANRAQRRAATKKN
jgi:hypothetical protein